MKHETSQPISTLCTERFARIGVLQNARRKDMRRATTALAGLSLLMLMAPSAMAQNAPQPPAPDVKQAQQPQQPSGDENASGKATIPDFAAKDDGEWKTASQNSANTRYSTLNEITSDNAKNLQVAFTFSTGVIKGQEAAPLVVDNTMYIVTAYPNILYALDLTKPGAPMKWSYQPNPEAASQGVACCDVVNRGAMYW